MLKATIANPAVETDMNKRWEKGIPHHPKSEQLYRFIAEVNHTLMSDSLCLKSGGDGDNGEELMYALDAYFEQQDSTKITPNEINTDYCQIEAGSDRSKDCGCSLGQCAKGLIF
jgi:hypothetical protein